MPPKTTGTNGWNEWSRHVLAELKRHDEVLTDIRNIVNKTHTEVAVLKFKSRLWGGLAGAVSFLALTLLGHLIGK